MTREKCGGHCPPVNISESTTINCRICANGFHLPCYDVIMPKAKIFLTDNIVFVCDDCLVELNKSPKRKNANNGPMLQSVLSTSITGNVGFTSQQNTPLQCNTGKASTTKITNDKLDKVLAAMATD